MNSFVCFIEEAIIGLLLRNDWVEAENGSGSAIDCLSPVS